MVTLKKSLLKVLLLTFSISACGAKGQIQTVTSFDQKFYQALNITLSQKEVILIPCFPTVEQRDYRYSPCFNQLRGSGQSIRQHMGQALEQAGFITTPSSIQGSELNATYQLPNSPFRIYIYFTDLGVYWLALQEKVGLIPPFRPQDVGAPYALLDPVDAAKIFTQGLLRFAKAPSTVAVQPCGSGGVTAASVCLTWIGKKDALHIMLRNTFFGGQQDWFATEESKGNYVYREEPLIAEMIQEGAISKDYKSSLHLEKVGGNHYVVRDSIDWPAYQFEITGTSNASGSTVKVTASRLKVAKK